MRERQAAGGTQQRKVETRQVIRAAHPEGGEETMSGHELLSRERALPRGAGQDNIVQWHVFRSKEAAAEFIPCIRLGPGQRLVGGYSRDSIGPLWWVGVQVDDLETWGNRGAVNKRAE